MNIRNLLTGGILLAAMGVSFAVVSSQNSSATISNEPAAASPAKIDTIDNVTIDNTTPPDYNAPPKKSPCGG